MSKESNLASARFDTYSVEAHYGLEMVCYQVHRLRPQTVRLCTDNPEIAKAAVRRLGHIKNGLYVENEEIAEMVYESLGVRPKVVREGANDEVEVDVVLVLFSRRQYSQPPRARHLILLGRNSLSYKSLLYPRQVPDNVISQLRWLRREYTIEERIGLYGPQFLTFSTLSVAAGQRRPPDYFQFGQRAMDNLYTSFFWWMSYITIFVATREK